MTSTNKWVIVLFILGTITLALFYPHNYVSAQVPIGQDIGSAERDAEATKKKERALQRLKEGKKEVEILDEEDVIKPEMPSKEPKMPETKILINKISVEGVTVLKDRVIRSLVAPYEGKELSLEDFRNITDSVTDEYRKRGYVTSIAYMPPQKIEQNTLKIHVSEGRIGNVTLEGNKYFKKDLLLRHVELKTGEIFNYDDLRKNINYINEHPDRSAKIVLEKGTKRAETDVNIKVKDQLPLHATIRYNNYLSEYLGKNQYSVELKSTNFLGLDHIVSAEIQLGEDSDYHLYSARYLMPLTKKHILGAYYLNISQDLGGSLRELKVQGEGDIGSIYLSSKCIDTENLDINVSTSFVYKDIENKLLESVVSEDNVRIAKVGFDIDFNDRFSGRTIITQEFNYGIKDILGGLGDNDPKASRVGTGGEFFKAVTNVARIQSLPMGLSLMLRGGAQFTGDNLVSAEQFTIGGATTVRGYPVAEYVGDKGYNMSAEVYTPLFFDKVRFLGFFDWGKVKNRNPQVGETDKEEIYSAGPGLRFNIPEKLSVSFDYGFILGQEASDSSKSRGYIEAKLFF